MSVLVVEDDARLRDLLDVVVRRCGLTCHSVTFGDIALDAIRTEKYSVVLLDLMPPRMTGFDVLRSLLATHPHLLRRIIVITALSQAAIDRQFDAQSLVWGIVRKPFDVGHLMQLIDACYRFHTTKWPDRAELSHWLADRTKAAGAQAALIAVTAGEPNLQIVAAHGFRARLVKKNFPLPIAAGYPICVAVRSGRPVWLASVAADMGYPLCSIWTESGSNAIATVPLRSHGVVAGAIGWSFPQPQPFDHKQRAFLLEAASDCAA
ncbi:MAG TPA: response regulator, partial [Thermoanaerobaculia bacterium]|nr:response regulator [Thermoanaerobaculia bacterium]